MSEFLIPKTKSPPERIGRNSATENECCMVELLKVRKTDSQEHSHGHFQHYHQIHNTTVTVRTYGHIITKKVNKTCINTRISLVYSLVNVGIPEL